MSLLKANSIQIGQSSTATQNFTISVPASPDGTVKLARGNSGATTADVLSVGSGSELSLFTSNTERLRIDSSGNVGVGNASPNRKLDVKGSNAGGDFLALRLWNESTNTSNSSTSIDIPVFNGAGGLTIKQQTSSSQNYNCSILTQQSTASLILGSGANTERLRITSGGFLKASDSGTYVSSTGSYHEFRNSTSNESLLVSNSESTTPYGIQVRFTATPNNTTSQFLNCTDGNGSTSRAVLRSNGGFLNYQANDGNLSDERLKKDITASPSYLDKICSIPVVKFKYKDQTHDDYNLGVIAQQVEAVCPELVDADGFGETPEDGIPLKSIYQTDLQYALMKCIHELKAKNDILEAKVAALEEA